MTFPKTKRTVIWVWILVSGLFKHIRQSKSRWPITARNIFSWLQDESLYYHVVLSAPTHWLSRQLVCCSNPHSECWKCIHISVFPITQTILRAVTCHLHRQHTEEFVNSMRADITTYRDWLVYELQHSYSPNSQSSELTSSNKIFRRWYLFQT